MTEPAAAVESASPVAGRVPRYRLVLRGESVVASVGISLAAIVLLAMGAAGWWTLQGEKAALEASRSAQVHSAGEMLSQSAEVMLAVDELSSLRRLVTDAARSYQFEGCRIVLADGQVVADATPARVTVAKLPEAFPKGTVAGELTVEGGKYTFPLNVAGKGKAKLEIEPAAVDATPEYWRTQAGVGGIGAATLVGLLVVYRRLRSRLRAVGAIGEALLAARAGEKSTEALSVAPDLGPEAEAWNALLEEKESLQKQQLAAALSQGFGNRREGKGQLEAACDAMSQGLLLVDEEMKVKFANGAATVFLGTNKEMIIGSSMEGMVKEPKVVSAIRSVAAQGARQRATVEWQRDGGAGGGGVLKFTVRPVRKEDGASAMIIIEDITQQRVAEEARNSFVAQATHELRTPLTNIRLYVETAIEDGEEDAATRAKCLNVINLEARRLERIVGAMLSISEIEAGAFSANKSELYAEQLFEELKEDYAEQAAEKGIELTFTLPPKLPVIKGDRDKIMVALHNLVGNGLKYTPRGGKVAVSVDVRQDKFVVDVADTGYGISEEDQARIFEKFYRAQDPRVGKITGTGLGLTLAQEVVRLHGGSISVTSELNKGSTFTITLPLDAGTVAKAA